MSSETKNKGSMAQFAYEASQHSAPEGTPDESDHIEEDTSVADQVTVDNTDLKGKGKHNLRECSADSDSQQSPSKKIRLDRRNSELTPPPDGWKIFTGSTIVNLQTNELIHRYTKQTLGTLPHDFALGNTGLGESGGPSSEGDLNTNDLDFDGFRYQSPKKNCPGEKNGIWKLEKGSDPFPAQINEPDVSKFVIIRRSNKAPFHVDIRCYRDIQEFDWNSSASVGRLNKWRKQYTRRFLGASNPARLPWTILERNKLEELVKKEVRKTHNAKLGIDWKAVTKQLNDYFKANPQPKGGQIAPRIRIVKGGDPVEDPSTGAELKMDRVNFDRTHTAIAMYARKVPAISQILKDFKDHHKPTEDSDDDDNSGAKDQRDDDKTSDKERPGKEQQDIATDSEADEEHDTVVDDNTKNKPPASRTPLPSGRSEK